ncbi:Hypothetical protein A7982_01765 [Minicystis rosea]|nr:Hypothetical protein A7982_01765 [Minicystis rosea]
MQLVKWGVLVSVAFAGLTACGSGGGGSGGNGGSGGGGGSVSTGCAQCWPQCFLDMFADCTPAGACTQETGATTVNACYANGVKVSTGLGAAGASLIYYKADGSVCFTGDSTFSTTSVTATYKDTDGNVLLTDTTSLSGSTAQTIVCGGETYVVDPSSAACQSCQMGGSSSSCVNGACAIGDGS